MTSNPKQNGNIPMIIISGFALIATVIAGYLFWQNQLLSNKNPAPIQLPSVPQPVKPMSEMANWKTYNHNFNDSRNLYPVIEIKYPGNLSFQEQSLEGTADQQVTFMDSANKTLFSLKLSVRNFSDDKVLYSPVEPITIGSNMGYVSKNKQNYVSQYFFPGVKGHASLTLLDANFQSTFNLILSTFKFTENTVINAGVGSVTLRLKDWYYKEGTKVYTYKISYTKSPGDKEQVFKATSYGSNEFDSYLEITRGPIKLSLVPRPEGGNDLAEIDIPEVSRIVGARISTQPIFRIIDKANTKFIRYTYSDNFEQPCTTNNTAKACSGGLINKGSESYNIRCAASSNNLSACDDLFKSLDISVTVNIQ